MSDYALNAYDASVLVAERDTADFYETAAKASGDPKAAANWIMVELFGRLNKANVALLDSPISAEQIGALIGLIKDGTISGKIAKDVFDTMFETSKDPGVIVEEKGLKQITDTGAIEAIVDALIADNQGQVDAYRGGKTGLFGWFVGQVMKQTQGKANPGVVNQLLKSKLDV